MKTFSKDEITRRSFLRLARVMYEMWEEHEEHSLDTRLPDQPLIKDELVIAGRSLALPDNFKNKDAHREHIVPRLVLIEESKNIFETTQDPDVSIFKASEFLREHTKIVFISKDEMKRLDIGPGNLKQCMPEGWKVGDDIYQRLHIKDIKFQPL